MGFMTWDSRYEIGVSEMDEQHKKWLDLLNHFYDQLVESNLNAKMLKLIDEAIEYTHYHFSEEEKLLEKAGYPHVSEQKMMHKEINAMLTGFKDEITRGKLLISTKVTKVLKTWFNEHILMEDKKYADFLKQKA